MSIAGRLLIAAGSCVSALPMMAATAPNMELARAIAEHVEAAPTVAVGRRAQRIPLLLPQFLDEVLPLTGVRTAGQVARLAVSDGVPRRVVGNGDQRLL